MSKSRRRKQQRKSFPWPILIFGGLLLIVAALLFGSRANGGSGGGDNGAGTPKVTADPQKIDYGYVQFGNDKTFKLKVTNTGSGVLRFKEKPYIEVLEGC